MERGRDVSRKGRKGYEERVQDSKNGGREYVAFSENDAEV